ncbi:MAG: ABC transporter ATP-binding protein [Sedimentisphaerales bacterium]|nr:ABC transporter ATP-binding protein [Sedimentisphaerales bacterium]
MKRSGEIEVEGLTIRFAGRSIFEDFSLRIEPGEKVHLSGDSGAGKSTLLKSIFGFLEPEAGRIRIRGQLLTPESVWRLRTKMAFVPQEPDLAAGSVAQALERPFGYRANAHLRKNLARTAELTARFGLSAELLDKDVTSISGGEKQRIALITAILLDRKIILLDEPTSALDRQSKKAVAEYLNSCAETTILFAAHDAEALGEADRSVTIPSIAQARNKA